jgi:BirA family biotin operon repressor/biotin-[acetyl-CoA-carboxylase] ligase
MILRLETCASTMAEAARLAREGCASGDAVVAAEQTAGRGRYARPWHSERGAGLYVSIVFRLTLAEDSIPTLSLALGLAAAEAITGLTELACDLRWPNDVLIGGKKCAGILVETEGSAFIAGIGINVNQSEFPSELAGVATSLRLASGRTYSLDDLLTRLLDSSGRFTRVLEQEGRGAVIEAFTRASTWVRAKRVIVEQRDGTIEGVTDGLDPAGFLYVLQPGGARTLVRTGGVRAAG